MQVICVVIKKEVMLNRLEDLLAFNICVQKTFQYLRLYNSGRFQDWAKQSKVDPSQFHCNRYQMINQRTGCQKLASLKAAFY